MKILTIGATDIMGGAAKVSLAIRNFMEKQGHIVTSFVADKKSNDPSIKIIKRSKLRKIIGFLLSTEDLINTNWILKTKEFKEADIIHCHNLHGRFFNLKTLQKMSLKKPVIWTLHDEWAITPHCACTFEAKEIKNGLYVCPSLDTPPRLLWDNTKYLSWKKRYLYKKSKLNLVLPSLWLKKRVENTVLKEQSLTHIPNGIDVKIFKIINQEEARKKLNLPLDKKIVLSVADNGKNNIWKGWQYVQELVDKYKEKKDILFLNVGNHSKIEDTENLHFVEHISEQETLALYYNAADILIFTSLSENFPLVILEAMACGLPIVSFDVGGVKEVLENKVNGYLVGYQNSKSLEEGLELILNLTTEDRALISEKSSEKIQKDYSLDLMLQRYLDLYNKLIK